MSDLDDVLDQLGDKIAAKLRDLAPVEVAQPAVRLSTFGLAKAINAHPQTIRGWVRRGCPCLRVGRYQRFLLAEVEEWLRGQKGAA